MKPFRAMKPDPEKKITGGDFSDLRLRQNLDKRNEEGGEDEKNRCIAL